MSARNNDRFSEFIVGAFMVAVLALLAYFTIVISGVDLMVGREKARATFAFTDVGGLKERDDVVFRGMKVGTVERIALSPTNTLVTAKVDPGVTLRETGGATVAARSLLGGNYLLLEEGQGEPAELGGRIFPGESPVDWIRDLGRIARTLNTAASEQALRNIVSNFEATAENVSIVAERIARGEGTMGKLLSTDETVFADLKETVNGAKDAIKKVSETFGHAQKVAARIEKGEGTLGRLLSPDDTVYADLKKTFANAAEISSRLERGEGLAGRMLADGAESERVWGDVTNAVADVRAAFATLKETMEKAGKGDGLVGRAINDPQLAEDVAATLKSMKEVSRRLESGEGTLGKLVSETALHDEISALVKDVRQLVDNYRDTTPITTFGALATGAL